jgi:hypothetical protein
MSHTIQASQRSCNKTLYYISQNISTFANYQILLEKDQLFHKIKSLGTIFVFTISLASQIQCSLPLIIHLFLPGLASLLPYPHTFILFLYFSPSRIWSTNYSVLGFFSKIGLLPSFPFQIVGLRSHFAVRSFEMH